MREYWLKTWSFLRSAEGIIVVGSLMVVVVATWATVYWPMLTMPPKPSDQWVSPTDLEEEGKRIYQANGCIYCHSQYIRPQDWGHGAERIAEAGDYHEQRPPMLGSQRTGPDLSQEGGERSDDWHTAHFTNPRYTRPRSLMPRFGYLSANQMGALTAYMQSLGGKDAEARMDTYRRFDAEAAASYEQGRDENIRWLHSRVPAVWRSMPSESPATEASITRGEKVYQDHCIGCHGPVGDGNGPAAKHLMPPPVNFTQLKRHLVDGQFIGGILYYQIMNGVTGTAMPYFKKELESAKIWDVGNFISVNFINHRDDQILTEGIPAASEGDHAAPVTEEPQPGPIEPGRGAVR